MELLGGAGIGVVVGWIAPVVVRRTARALLASVAIVAIACLALTLQIGAQAAFGALVASVSGAVLHAVWRDLVSKRAGARPAPGRSPA